MTLSKSLISLNLRQVGQVVQCMAYARARAHAYTHGLEPEDLSHLSQLSRLLHWWRGAVDHGGGLSVLGSLSGARGAGGAEPHSVTRWRKISNPEPLCRLGTMTTAVERQ